MKTSFPLLLAQKKSGTNACCSAIFIDNNKPNVTRHPSPPKNFKNFHGSDEKILRSTNSWAAGSFTDTNHFGIIIDGFLFKMF